MDAQAGVGARTPGPGCRRSIHGRGQRHAEARGDGAGAGRGRVTPGATPPGRHREASGPAPTVADAGRRGRIAVRCPRPADPEGGGSPGRADPRCDQDPWVRRASPRHESSPQWGRAPSAARAPTVAYPPLVRIACAEPRSPGTSARSRRASPALLEAHVSDRHGRRRAAFARAVAPWSHGGRRASGVAPHGHVRWATRFRRFGGGRDRRIRSREPGAAPLADGVARRAGAESAEGASSFGQREPLVERGRRAPTRRAVASGGFPSLREVRRAARSPGVEPAEAYPSRTVRVRGRGDSDPIPHCPDPTAPGSRRTAIPPRAGGRSAPQRRLPA